LAGDGEGHEHGGDSEAMLQAHGSSSD
jgi:hypothetical protein